MSIFYPDLRQPICKVKEEQLGNRTPSRLGTCEGENSFALAYQLRFETNNFERVLASLSKRRLEGQGKKKIWPSRVPSIAGFWFPS